MVGETLSRRIGKNEISGGEIVDRKEELLKNLGIQKKVLTTVSVYDIIVYTKCLQLQSVLYILRYIKLKEVLCT